MDDVLDVLESPRRTVRGAGPSNGNSDFLLNVDLASCRPKTSMSELTEASNTRESAASRGKSGDGNKKDSKDNDNDEVAEVKKATRPMFEANVEVEHIDIKDEEGYRKPIYAADFVDFENDICKTPRIVRPHTEVEERPGTSVSWISSTPSESTTAEKPLDTWVDENRLLHAFEKIREAFVMELDRHGESKVGHYSHSSAS